MSFLGDLYEQRFFEISAGSFGNAYDVYHSLLDGAPTHAGVRVDEKSSLSLGVVFACIRAIAWTVGTLPKRIFEGESDGEKKLATDHPVQELLLHDPNPYIRPQVFWETLIGHACSWGGAFAEIEYRRPKSPPAAAGSRCGSP